MTRSVCAWIDSYVLQYQYDECQTMLILLNENILCLSLILDKLETEGVLLHLLDMHKQENAAAEMGERKKEGNLC